MHSRQVFHVNIKIKILRFTPQTDICVCPFPLKTLQCGVRPVTVALEVLKVLLRDTSVRPTLE